MSLPIARAESSPPEASIPERPGELDWYLFENRIRSIIHQLVEPYALKAINGAESVQVVKRDNEKLKRRVDELEFMLHKSHQRASGIEDVTKQILDLVRTPSFNDIRTTTERCTN